jgi:hypothetical protein
MTLPQPLVMDGLPDGQHDVPVRYRLWSEDPVDSTDEWEIRWRPMLPANGPSIIRRLSRGRFLALDATGLLDSCYAFTAASLASFLSESLPLRDVGSGPDPSGLSTLPTGVTQRIHRPGIADESAVAAR